MCLLNFRKGTLFPEKLHCMLDYAEDEGMEDVLSWNPNGLAFTIHDPDRLTRAILPLFLGATKYKSFLRQLYHWSFQRDTTSNVESHNDVDNIDSIDNIDNKNSDSNDNHSDNNDRKNSKNRDSSPAMFTHPYFIRGKKSLCEHLTRESFKRSSNPTHGQVSTPVTTTTNTTVMDAKPACCIKLMLCEIRGSNVASSSNTGPSPKILASADDDDDDDRTSFQDGDLIDFEGKKFYFLDSDNDK
jgi:hypothetical protein